MPVRGLGEPQWLESNEVVRDSMAPAACKMGQTGAGGVGIFVRSIRQGMGAGRASKAAQRGCRLSQSQPLVHIKQPTLAARVLHPHHLLQLPLTESVEGRQPSERSRERRSSVAMAAAVRRALGLCGGGGGSVGANPGACTAVWPFRGTSQRGWRPQRGRTSGAQAAAYWSSLTGETPLVSGALLAP